MFNKVIFLSLLLFTLLPACSANGPKTISLNIYSEPEGATIISDGKVWGQTPLILKYTASKADVQAGSIKINPITAKWKSGATAILEYDGLITKHSSLQVTIRRPAGVAGLNTDIEVANGLKATREKIQLQRELANVENNAQRKQNQIAAGLEMMRTGKLPTFENNVKSSIPPVYSSAITVSAVDFCPLTNSLGRYSHSTSKGLNKICYYK